MVKREKYKNPVGAPLKESTEGIIRNYNDFITE